LEDVSGTATRLAQAMTGHLFYDIPDEEDPDGMYARPSLETMNLLRYVLAELLENALTHARSEGFGGASVWVAANYYRSTGELCLAVVDNGCGFLRSLGQHPNVRIHPSDALAIRTALEPFVSRNRAVGILNAPSNQGIGLTMSRDIVVKSDGIVSITSGSGSVWDHQYGRSSWERRLPWQGAIIDAKLRRDALLNIALADIASQYHQAIKPNLLYE
jgi:signal transduction histidine kinase